MGKKSKIKISSEPKQHIAEAPEHTQPADTSSSEPSSSSKISQWFPALAVIIAIGLFAWFMNSETSETPQSTETPAVKTEKKKGGFYDFELVKFDFVKGSRVVEVKDPSGTIHQWSEIGDKISTSNGNYYLSELTEGGIIVKMTHPTLSGNIILFCAPTKSSKSDS